MTLFFVLSRAVHIGACLVLFAFFAFDRFILANQRAAYGETDYWPSRLRLFTRVLLPVIFISGIAWFILVAAAMSGEPPRLEILKTVWTQTQFGTVWKIRLFLWLADVIIICLGSPEPTSPIQKSLTWLPLGLSAALLGALAWAGHGQEDSSWHLLADIVHLVAAGFWPAGLLPLALLLNHHRRNPGAEFRSTVAIVRRFSAWSLVCVTTLAASGLTNTWYLVGSLSNLVNEPYGRWLSLKILLFSGAITIGAINLLRLKPCLSASDSPSTVAAVMPQLHFNVILELFFGTAILLVVAILGMLPP
jgi:putative copper resistance protein D